MAWLLKLSFYCCRLFLLIFTVYGVQTLDLVADYKGTSFFDEWNFYGAYDNLTSGDVIWVDKTNATASRLAFVNSAGRAIVKVDNTTNVPYNIKRNSVRIETQKAFGRPSLFIADFVHMPYGCSVWPAFWSKGVHWPSDGEIDIMEGVNLMTQNQMALHTRPGCLNVLPAPGAQSGQTGPLDCSLPSGCTVTETKANSFGRTFAQAGGGVFATQFDVAGIFIWFWNRPNIPTSISRAAASTAPITSLSDWGTPSASFPSSASCNISRFFDPQTLVLDITLCGIWAGLPSIYSPRCASEGTTGLCYNDNVIGSGNPKYDNAYFEVNYIRVYGTSSSNSSEDVTQISPKSSGSTGHPSTLGLPGQQLAALVMGAMLIAVPYKLA